MVSNVEDAPMTTLAGLEMNTLADGLLPRRHVVPRPRRRDHRGEELAAEAAHAELGFQLGLMAMGWGVFNVVEGLDDHLLLGSTTSAMTSGTAVVGRRRPRLRELLIVGG
ncbi:MAG: DUF2243 domain-containing protein [Intrasporangium sp.]|nr:DUF2243 domain-containing protein [Intrasporangium sp.]